MAKSKHTGCPTIQDSLFFCFFVSLYSFKMQKLGEYCKIQEICNMIGTRIFQNPPSFCILDYYPKWAQYCGTPCMFTFGHFLS